MAISKDSSLHQKIDACWDTASQSFKTVLQGSSQIVIEALNTAGAGDTIRAYDPLQPVGYDNIQYSYPNVTTTVETYRSAAVSVGIITKVYTDSTKTALSSVTRS